MARLLYVTVGLSGGLNSSLELARRLREQGHTISFLGHRDLGERIEKNGFQYERLLEDDLAMSTLRGHVDEVGTIRALPRAKRLRQALISSGEIEHAVAEIDPDVLIIDIEAHYAIIATHSLGIPTITKSDFFSMAHQRGVPPLHSPRSMPTSISGRLYAELDWAKARAQRIMVKTIGELHPRRLARRWAPFRYNTVMRRDLKAVAKARGLRLDDISSQAGWLWPQTYPDLPLLSATPAELDFVTRPSTNDRWIGPLIPASRPETDLAVEQNKAWQTFKNRNAQSGRPLVYCSFGTMLPDTTAMVQVIIDATTDRGEWDLLVGLGGRTNQTLTNDTGEHVLVLDFAPQLDVLAAADLAIIHGGINGILESLLFGVPMIVERGGLGDQPGNAIRVDHFGVGRAVAITELGAAGLASLIGQVLNDQTLRSRVSQLRQQLDAYTENRVLENFFDQFLDSTLEGG